ncbi:hypothetical protein QVD17_06006 [Tagetes erecta]|uniref:Uncharacterized protein n=1 Tax=Tagetes erecta TaxID=13708 RepID=A0AAD8LJC2_TARER|nr:hypothetical protein QVD17_06006 [Tagetes erecta]
MTKDCVPYILPIRFYFQPLLDTSQTNEQTQRLKCSESHQKNVGVKLNSSIQYIYHKTHNHNLIKITHTHTGSDCVCVCL